MSTQEFEIPPPGKFAMMFPLIIGIVPTLGILTAIALSGREPKALLAALPALLILPLAAGGLAWSMHRQKIRLVDKVLSWGVMPWRRTTVAALDLDAARIVNLDEVRELQPVFKFSGTSLPGYRSGKFRLRNRQRASLLLTEWRRVLVLPRRDGGPILLSAQKPDALLDALRRASR